MFNSKVLMITSGTGSFGNTVLIGYIPVVFLTVNQNHKFQTGLVTALAVIILTAIFISAFYQKIYLICWAYVSYYIFATIAIWQRSLQLPHVKEYSMLALKYTLLWGGGILLITSLLFNAVRLLQSSMYATCR